MAAARLCELMSERGRVPYRCLPLSIVRLSCTRRFSCEYGRGDLYTWVRSNDAAQPKGCFE